MTSEHIAMTSWYVEGYVIGLCLILEDGVGEARMCVVHSECVQAFIVPVIFMRFLQ